MRCFNEIFPNVSSKSAHLTATAAILGAILVGGVIKTAKSLCRTNELKSRVKRRLLKREKEFDRIRQLTADIPDDFVDEILNKTMEEILDGLRAGEWKCLQILRVFQKAALRAQEKTNCIVEFLEEADKRGEALDAAGSDPDYKKPQLFGLPISIKSCIAVQGHDLFSGYADNLEKPQAEDSLLVQELFEFPHLLWNCLGQAQPPPFLQVQQPGFSPRPIPHLRLDWPHGHKYQTLRQNASSSMVQ
uniref:Amidase domain-containing protein n=1 Tax=Bursaphelenchus xylophilus TaxID=6326 RepID=A0A1I7RN37_BURXY